MLLLDFVQDLGHLGVGNINGHQDFGTGATDHTGNALDIHAGVDCVDRGAHFIQCIECNNGFRGGCGKQRHNSALLNAKGCKCICALINSLDQTLDRDFGTIIINGSIMGTVLVYFFQEGVNLHLGEGCGSACFRIVLHPNLFSTGSECRIHPISFSLYFLVFITQKSTPPAQMGVLQHFSQFMRRRAF